MKPQFFVFLFKFLEYVECKSIFVDTDSIYLDLANKDFNKSSNEI